MIRTPSSRTTPNTQTAHSNNTKEQATTANIPTTPHTAHSFATQSDPTTQKAPTNSPLTLALQTPAVLKGARNLTTNLISADPTLMPAEQANKILDDIKSCLESDAPGKRSNLCSKLGYQESQSPQTNQRNIKEQWIALRAHITEEHLPKTKTDGLEWDNTNSGSLPKQPPAASLLQIIIKTLETPASNGLKRFIGDIGATKTMLVNTIKGLNFANISGPIDPLDYEGNPMLPSESSEA